MDEHPLIRFSDGPAGRRARLIGTGKDIWEIIVVVRDNDSDPAEAARYLEIPLGLIHAAISYYGTHTTEIDQLTPATTTSPTERPDSTGPRPIRPSGKKLGALAGQRHTWSSAPEQRAQVRILLWAQVKAVLIS